MNSRDPAVSRNDGATRQETHDPTHTDSTSRTTRKWRELNHLCLPVEPSTANGTGIPGTAEGVPGALLGRDDRALLHLRSAVQGFAGNVNHSQQPQESAIEAQRMAALREAKSQASFNPSSGSARGAP